MAAWLPRSLRFASRKNDRSAGVLTVAAEAGVI
jgi:hypothetical protein